MEKTTNAWLVRRTGMLAGMRHLVRNEVTRAGRSPDNDLVFSGEEALVVSGHHLEIRKGERGYRICDLGSTNGTYLNGASVTEAPLEAPASIRLGSNGPELAFVMGGAAVDLDATLDAAPPLPGPAEEMRTGHEQLLLEAVQRARAARGAGLGDHTVAIMRSMLRTALGRTKRPLKSAIAALLAMLLAVSGYAYWKVRELERQKAAIDGRIVDLEAALAKGGHPPAELSQILERLDEAQAEASALARNPLFRLGGGQQPEDFVREEIRRLLAEFGDQVYSIPPEFVEQVNGQVARYQGADRAHIERALGQRRGQLEAVRRLLEQEKLPPDLAYITLVESTFDPAGESAAGAAGVWQFTAATARAYGLRVTPQIDERLDLNKSTRVACRYLRELILDFGAGTSVMLALAAYNLGPAKVKQAVRKVEDPIRQRNFWHLYRVRALPPETRQFVPKVFAVILISRHPERFGFTGPKGRA